MNIDSVISTKVERFEIDWCEKSKQNALKAILVHLQNQSGRELSAQAQGIFAYHIDLIQSYVEPLAFSVGTLFSDINPEVSSKLISANTAVHTVGVSIQIISKAQEGYLLILKEKALDHFEKNLDAFSGDDQKVVKAWLEGERKKVKEAITTYLGKLMIEAPSFLQDMTSTFGLLATEVALPFSAVVKLLSLGKWGYAVYQQGKAVTSLKTWQDGVYFHTGKIISKPPSTQGIAKASFETPPGKQSEAGYQVTKNALLSLAAMKRNEAATYQETRLCKTRFDYVIGVLATLGILTAKTVVFAGVALPLLSIIAWTSLIYGGLGVLALGIALYYLYKERPHLLEQIKNFIPAKLSYYKMTLSWNEFLMKKKQVECFGAKEKDKIRLFQEFEGYKTKVQELKEKVQTLQNNWHEAVYKDSMIENPTIDKGLNELASMLFQDIKEHKKLLEEVLGISINEEITKDKILEAIEVFLSLDETEMQARFVK